MPEFKQANRPLRITLGDVTPDGVLLTGFSGTETISRLYTFTLTLVAPADAPLAFADVLGKPAVVEIDQETGQTRFVHGIVSRLRQGRRDSTFAHSVAELVPPLWLLSRTTRSRIFQQKTTREILDEVLGPLYSPEFKLEATYHPRNFCAQYRESDFAFVSRLMEEEGMYYFFTHTADEHKLVISDNPRGHADTPDDVTLVFLDASLARPNEGRVIRWEKAQALRTGAVDLTDHWFEMPTNDLRAVGMPLDSAKAGSVAHELGLGQMNKTAVVEHPGGYAHWRDGIAPGGAPRPADLDPLFEDNARIAGVRMDQEQTGAVRIDGAGSYCRMTAGHKFTLAEHLDADGDYVAVSVAHDATCGVNTSGGPEDFAYRNEFECLPFDLPFRPLRETPRPVVKGTQTAVVVGDDPEIEPDKYGRVKVHFRWDPQAARGLDTSCWVRVAQFWAGRQWGAQFIPRVGDEVVVAFLEGDPDQPLIIGSVYNADNMPIYKLPENKTQSGIKTTSYPGGTSQNFNQITFEDKKGAEQVIIHAEKDMAVTVEDNYTLNVGAAQKDPKKAGTSSTTTFGDTSYTVTKGDYSFSVSAGKAGYFVKGPVTETFDDTQSTTVTNSIAISSKSSFVHVTSPTEILLTVGGSTLRMTPDSIVLSATKIHFEGGAKVTGKAPLVAFEGTADFKASAPNVIVDGKSDAAFQSSGGPVTVSAASTATLGVGGNTVMCDTGKVAVSGAQVKAAASGTHEITGALVKIN
jgi:type VI secretion system secreted protein VgrG